MLGSQEMILILGQASLPGDKSVAHPFPAGSRGRSHRHLWSRLCIFLALIVSLSQAISVRKKLHFSSRDTSSKLLFLSSAYTFLKCIFQFAWRLCGFCKSITRKKYKSIVFLPYFADTVESSSKDELCPYLPHWWYVSILFLITECCFYLHFALWIFLPLRAWDHMQIGCVCFFLSSRPLVKAVIRVKLRADREESLVALICCTLPEKSSSSALALVSEWHNILQWSASTCVLVSASHPISPMQLLNLVQTNVAKVQRSLRYRIPAVGMNDVWPEDCTQPCCCHWSSLQVGKRQVRQGSQPGGRC